MFSLVSLYCEERVRKRFENEWIRFNSRKSNMPYSVQRTINWSWGLLDPDSRPEFVGRTASSELSTHSSLQRTAHLHNWRHTLLFLSLTRKRRKGSTRNVYFAVAFQIASSTSSWSFWAGQESLRYNLRNSLLHSLFMKAKTTLCRWNNFLAFLFLKLQSINFTYDRMYI